MDFLKNISILFTVSFLVTLVMGSGAYLALKLIIQMFGGLYD